MRRKDLLIIIAVLIIAAFVAVSAIYWIANGENPFNKIAEVVNPNKEYHSNGWSTAIVDKIVEEDVPVPVGFSYEAGEKETGIVIRDKETGEKYMWIPTSAETENVEINTTLETSNKGSKENMETYKGFYVAIDERTEEEIFEEYLRKTTRDYDEYKANKELKPYEYKSMYRELTGQEIDINGFDFITEEIKIENLAKTGAYETHTLTQEELAKIEAYEQQIGSKITIKDYKTLTILGEGQENKSEAAKKVTDNNNETVYIPKGFEYVEGTVKTGYKIKNAEGLTFIWIPVKDVKRVKDEFILKAVEAGYDEALEINVYNNYIDEENETYNELLKSIDKYGGFYISEAELGYDENNKQINTYRGMKAKEGNYVSEGDYYRNVEEENKYKDNEGNLTKLGQLQDSFKLTYEKAKSKSEELYTTESVVTHLTYGLEYDAAILYLLENCDKVTLEDLFNDSGEIGKYRNNSENWKNEELSTLNGIYGLGGNLAEITQEKDGENIIIRGGSYATDSNVDNIATKQSKTKEEIENSADTLGFRACMYIRTQSIEGEVKKEEDLIKIIEEYPENKEGYTYGNEETKQKCEDLKERTIEYIKNCKVYNGIIKDKDGKTVTVSGLFENFKQAIKEVRDTYRKVKIAELIENYNKYSGEYIDIIKGNAKEHIMFTEDLDKIPEIVENYKGVMEVANVYANLKPITEEHKEIWEDIYIRYIKEYTDIIVKNAYNKEEAAMIAIEGVDKINELATEKIKEVKTDEGSDTNKSGEVKKEENAIITSKELNANILGVTVKNENDDSILIVDNSWFWSVFNKSNASVEKKIVYAGCYEILPGDGWMISPGAANGIYGRLAHNRKHSNLF